MMKTPDLKPRIIKLKLDYANKLLGLDLKKEELKKLLEKMRYGVSQKGDLVEVMVPAYRTDVLHPMDIVEDVAIAYGYDRFSPTKVSMQKIGSKDKLGVFCNNVRELMIGFGFQEVVTLIMTNKNDLFTRMNLKDEKVVETENPVSVEHSIARNWLLPSLMLVLEKNKNREYPQRIFEIGECINTKGEGTKKLAGAIANSKTNFSEIKSFVIGILDSLNTKGTIKKFDHNSFIPGRCASFEFGFFGEMSPEVLSNFSLEVPITAFEINLSKIFESKFS